MAKARQEMTAIIYDKRGRVLSVGYNSYVKTHPMMKQFSEKVGESSQKQFLHAECHAITRCAELDKAYRIMVFRYGPDGKTKLAKPCKVCESLIKSIPNIKIVEWTTGE